MPNSEGVEREFHVQVLGRTLQHLGVQMYKRRDVAIAELVANCWDAGAKRVWVDVPEGNYDASTSVITITDDGIGMTANQVENKYLVVGRNRRTDRDDADRKVERDRPVMGRKGIGKLAGFGIARSVEVYTWSDGTGTYLPFSDADLTADAGKSANVTLKGREGVSLPKSMADKLGGGKGKAGTQIKLSTLKHKTPLDVPAIRRALARRFARRVRGEMVILVNGQPLGNPYEGIKLEKEVPEDEGMLLEERLEDGEVVKYRYAFSASPVRERELQGFTIYVRGKTAQAPPFFFHVEATASGQHATRYVFGEIHADFLDAGDDDESDLISTDRQEIDWDAKEVLALRQWGQQLSRRLLREWTDDRGERAEKDLSPELTARVERLDQASQTQLRKFLRTLGASGSEPERVGELSDALVRAYEYRQFQDVVKDIEEVGEDPAKLKLLLDYLHRWRSMEGRAILEIIKGRISIIEKFHAMIVKDAPETKSSTSKDNMHDLLAAYPWLINADWEVLAEERSVTKQLQEMAGGEEHTDKEQGQRFDFLALAENKRLFIVEIKRSGHAVTLVEINRLEQYCETFRSAYDDVTGVLIYGGKLDLRDQTKENVESRQHLELVTWEAVHRRTERQYTHYRAVLESEVEHDDFRRKEREVGRTRSILERGNVHRPPKERAKGLGEQDVTHKRPDIATDP